MSIRKFFGVRPTVGDRINTFTDFGVRFEGVIISDNRNEGFPHYIADGTFTIQTEWEGTITHHDKEAIIPTLYKKIKIA